MARRGKILKKTTFKTNNYDKRRKTIIIERFKCEIDSEIKRIEDMKQLKLF